MLIECPSCHARATLPSSKEGAKVRCGECSRVYVARPRDLGSQGQNARDRGSNTSRWILGGGIVVALIALAMLMRDSRTQPEPVTQAAAPAPVEPTIEEMALDWDMDPVQAAVRIHEAAAAQDAGALANALHAPGALAFRALAAELDDIDAALEVDLLASDRTRAFAELDAGQRAQAIAELAGALVAGELEEGDLVGGWRAYDVEGLELGDGTANFRLAVTARDPERAGEKRFVEWRMAKLNGTWKAWAWRRWIDESERKARLRHGTKRVTLSDGFEVIEREPEPLGHLDNTPPELRELIDALIATMTDLDLTREASAAKRKLVSTARPAIPLLLTQLYENPLENQDQAIQANIVVEALREITGQRFGYRPAVGGGALSTTQEHRTSSVRQWFAWWYRNELSFVEKKEGEDGLEGLIELSEDDKRWLERYRNK